MNRFAALLDRLVYTPSRTGKLRLLAEYFHTTPDPDRGWALAALTDGIDFPAAKPAMIRDLAMSRIDPELFGWSYDFVGDLAETTALIWPEHGAAGADPPGLTEIVEALASASRAEAPTLLAGWLDRLDATGRWGLLKLVTGGLRVGVSARLAKTALADIGHASLEEVEEVWHGLSAPYRPLFEWLAGGARPATDGRAVFRPLMLAHPLEEAEAARLDLAAYAAEWKWDGIRVQLAVTGGERRLYSRSGESIGGAFPEIVEAMAGEAVLDGELLVLREEEVAPFNDLQQRLNRRAVTARMMERFPAHVRLYDILFDGREDLRGLPFVERRARLEGWVGRERPARMDLSPMIGIAGREDLDALRSACRGRPVEGLMLKRWDSPYIAGRPKGPWFKWKRGPLTVDAVLMYAQRGHGKRSSFYSDYTFGVWMTEGERDRLVPVGKAYFGFTDAELAEIDRWIRHHTVARYGPVREVEPGLVLEVAFDSLQRSTRHRSGVAMRFPRISRIRWDKPAREADRLNSLVAFMESPSAATVD